MLWHMKGALGVALRDPPSSIPFDRRQTEAQSRGIAGPGLHMLHSVLELASLIHVSSPLQEPGLCPDHRGSVP